MITIFICTDDVVAKEITTKYLNKDTMPYVNMLEVSYHEATKKIEELEVKESFDLGDGRECNSCESRYCSCPQRTDEGDWQDVRYVR